MYGKKSTVTPPMRSPIRRGPRIGDMNEAMGSAAIMTPAPVTPPARSPRRRKSPGHNTTLGKYAE
jgi:hypothetical protein